MLALRNRDPGTIRRAALSLTEDEARSLLYDWRYWARPEQLEPGTPGAAIARTDWRYWLLQAGRGFGKTRTGAEQIISWVGRGRGRIALVAPTASDARDVMVEGESGIMNCCPPWNKPIYEPSKRRVTWANGAQAITYSADEPERLRGPQHDGAWCDELASYRYPEAWDNLLFGLRLGDDPRALITTTPKPLKLMREIIGDPNTVVTRGDTYANRANLPAAFLDSIIKKYEGTRLGRQEIYAELLSDTPGALWTRGMLAAAYCKLSDCPTMVRIVIAIDPAVTATDDSDETGIVAVGLGTNGHLYLFEDGTMRDSPLAWARQAIAMFIHFKADRMIGETNNGGDLVQANIQAAAGDVFIPFRKVHASRGKAVRAEPVAALYEQGRFHHVIQRTGQFDLLEDQLCQFVPGSKEKSPDRMDALVWAATDLLIDPAIEETTVVYDDWEAGRISSI